jgi:hypothetical protein
MSKSVAYVIGMVCIMIIFLLMFAIALIKGLFDLIPVGMVLTAVVSLTGGYMGIQVVNNGVKGKFWNQDMHNSTNSIDEDKGV